MTPKHAPTTDQRRFEQLFERHRRSVLGYALRRVDEPADAADVLAETFLIAWRRLGGVPEGDDARPWLFAVARRVLANQRRGERRRDGLAERLGQELTAQFPAGVLAGGGDPAVFGEDDASGRRVREALAQLTEEDHEILQLAAWEGLTPAEIAVVLGVRSVTARSRLHRARRRLRAQLDATAADPPPAPPPIAVRAAAAWRTPAAASPHRHGRAPEHTDHLKEMAR